MKCWYSVYPWVLRNISQYAILLLKVSSGQKADKINAKRAAVVVNFTWLMATHRKTERRRHKGYVPHANLRVRKLSPYNSSCVLPNLYRRWKWQIIWAFTPRGDVAVFLCPALDNPGHFCHPAMAMGAWMHLHVSPARPQTRARVLGWHLLRSQEHHGVPQERSGPVGN